MSGLLTFVEGGDGGEHSFRFVEGPIIVCHVFRIGMESCEQLVNSIYIFREKY